MRHGWWAGWLRCNAGTLRAASRGVARGMHVRTMLHIVVAAAATTAAGSPAAAAGTEIGCAPCSAADAAQDFALGPAASGLRHGTGLCANASCAAVLPAGCWPLRLDGVLLFLEEAARLRLADPCSPTVPPAPSSSLRPSFQPPTCFLYSSSILISFPPLCYFGGSSSSPWSLSSCSHCFAWCSDCACGSFDG